MALAPGTRIGPYEVVAQIGVGGMGEVYRAKDTTLGRDVALKLLPDGVTQDPERLARFDREARTLAALNHPNIAHLYGVERTSGTPALVMELVEGPTLADRIAQGPIPLAEALPIARQIADALEAAHEQGIIHRDLKPANIKVRDDGTVKVLDFGLAKALAPESADTGGALSMSPTITTPALMTGAGVLLGTAAYMSPEQAKGRPADKRSDVWAFGAVLYEMLTGARAFDGDDMVDVLGAVARLEPDWSRVPPDAPAAVRTLLERCLTKDRRQRISDISTAKFIFGEFSRLAPQAAAPQAASVPASRRRVLGPAVAAAALAAAVAGGGAWSLRPAPSEPPVAKFSFTLAEQEGFNEGFNSFVGFARQGIGISPDGTRIAYVLNSRIHIRALGDLTTHPVPGSETTSLGIVNPMFTPDGQSIVFLSVGEGGGPNAGSTTIKRIPISGGAAATVATLETAPSGANVGPGGILVGQENGIVRVPLAGGVPEHIVDAGPDETLFGPQMLPDGRTVIFTLAHGTSQERWDKAQIVAQSITGGTRRVLIDGGADGRYLSTGHLLYAVGGTVFAVPFDAQRLAVTGAPVSVIASVRRSAGRQMGTMQVAVSDNGTLAYVPGFASLAAGAQGLVIGSASTGPQALKIPTGDYAQPRVSPDGTVLAVARRDAEGSDIFTYDLSGSTEMRRLTFGGQSRYPVWSADGKRVAFQSARESAKGVFWQAADGSGSLEQLTTSADGEEHLPESWSRDGRHLLVSVLKDKRYTLWVVTPSDKTLERFGRVESAEPPSATFSPDGRWVAYAATAVAGGTLSRNRGVFVEPFPPTGEKHQVPKQLIDYHPAWSPDGRRIFYVPAASRPVVAVEVTTQPSVSFGTPIDRPEAPRPGILSGGIRGYDVLPDGRVLGLGTGNVGETDSTNNSISVTLNWFEELKRLAPTATK